MSLLHVTDLTVAYGGLVAVREASFEVDEAETVAVLGANGAGKTSTLRAVSGLEPVRRGTIAFAGEDITGLAPDAVARLGIAHVPAGRGIFGRLTVSDNLRMALSAVGQDGSAQGRERLDDVFGRFPILADRRAQPAGTLSGGQQQQLAIARALVQRPALLLLDEMSMGLSPLIVAELFEIVAGLKDTGVAVILVEQFVHQALGVADRVVLLEQGRVVADRSTADLTEDDVTAAYLGGGHDATVLRLDPPPDDAVESLRLKLPGRELRRLEELARERGTTLTELLEGSLTDLLEVE